jgi:hypothetical protein
MSHSYEINCNCPRCTKERTRRAIQSAANPKPIKPIRRYKKKRTDVASREEQNATLLECGYGAWDDRD